ncbi:antitoxin [Mycobacterium noviomagense]|uniref:Antitoxin n=1 Tax=Mycobacterium noviomagense TaxID=459858 RepID=A0A7I7PCP1_9MYCO|nr:antitoxin [Mycobacterium noviomagense]ORB11054.1 antitoxin [Mycobacterium noviomagense]BBY06255.1 antitoxin [Mycobacterium noviomagense]
MIRTQVQLPDELYRDAKRVAREHEMTLAEVVRRGLEHMVEIYPPRDAASDTWQPPTPRRLGSFRVTQEAWRELANEA